MKQYIDVEQLNELSDKAKERLREWWKPKDGDLYAHFIDKDFKMYGLHIYQGSTSKSELWHIMDGTDPDSFARTQGSYPLLSIGQMIELIDENDVGEWGIHNQAGDGWTISSNNLYAPQYYIPQHGTDSDSVCDCLWEAVKYILEND